MSDDSITEISGAVDGAGTTEAAGATPAACWPDDPVEMLKEMLSEQADALHGMFFDLRDFSVQTFREESPWEAQAYIRLALRAQTNCRSALAVMVGADRAARRGAPTAEGGAQ